MTAAMGRGWTLKSAYGLAVLTLIYAINYADRQILSLMLPSIKRDLHLSDIEIGVISGFAFVLFYSILGVPIARLADRANRRNILATGLAFWSVMTACSGWVSTAWQLGVTRFLMGAGESTCIAPSASMVGDMFDRTRRTSTLAILTSGSALSALLLFPLIGWFGQHYGWRDCFVAAGVVGALVSLLVIGTVSEPKRDDASGANRVQQEGIRATARFLWGARAYVLTVTGGAFIGIELYAGQVWHPSFLARVHHLNLVQIGTGVGLVRGLAGLLGTLFGGFSAERMGRRDGRWRLWVPGLACILVMPAEGMFLFSESVPMTFMGLALVQFLLAVHLGPVYSVCQNIARPTMRATATATFLLCANVTGQIIGPLSVGVLNDHWAALYGQGAIRYSLLVGAVCAGIGGILLTAGARHLIGDMARAEPPELDPRQT